MEENDNKRIDELERELAELKRTVYQNQFSNLFVFDEQVQFKTFTIYPKDETSVVVSGITVGSSVGRIKIKDSQGTTRYIPYF